MTGEMNSKSGMDDGRLKIAIQKSGRLSEKSFTNYKKLSKFAPWMFPNIDMILAQDSFHVQRFKLLNANSVQKVGTVKFDEVHIKNDLLNDDFIENFINKPFVLAASTHSGEEEIIISEYRQMRELISPLPIAVESSFSLSLWLRCSPSRRWLI